MVFYWRATQCFKRNRDIRAVILSGLVDMEGRQPCRTCVVSLSAWPAFLAAVYVGSPVWKQDPSPPPRSCFSTVWQNPPGGMLALPWLFWGGVLLIAPSRLGIFEQRSKTPASPPNVAGTLCKCPRKCPSLEVYLIRILVSVLHRRNL